MAEWWYSLETISQVFACIAIPFTLLLLIQTVMLFFGWGDDGTDGVDASGMDDPGHFGSDDGDIFMSDGLHLVSWRSIVAFLCIFGWLGLTLSANGAEAWLSVTVAIAGGFLAMLGVALLVKALSKLQSDGSLNLKYALGVGGERLYNRAASKGRSGKGEPYCARKA